MKKIVLVLVIFALIATSAFASIFQIGPMVRLEGPIIADLDSSLSNVHANTPDPWGNFDKYADINQYSFGLNMRLNLGAFSLQANSLYRFIGDEYNGVPLPEDLHAFDNTLYLTLNFKAGPIVLGFGAGPNIEVGTDFKGNNVVLIGTVIENNPEFVDTLASAKLIYKTNLMIDMGSINFDFAYVLPTKFSIKNPNWGEIIPDNVFEGKLITSLLFSF